MSTSLLDTRETIRLTATFARYSPLKRLLAAIEEHPYAPLSMKQAARIAGLEATYFSRWFHQKTGLKYKHWSDVRRMEMAARKLEDSDDTITQIAAKFDLDITTFERTFRRVIGMAPKAYRRFYQDNAAKRQISQVLPINSQKTPRLIRPE